MSPSLVGEEKPKLIVVLGPTASGKSEIGVHIAESLGADVISADSLQVYKYLSIGTAKPTLQEQESVVHHLLDVVDPDEEFNAGLFRRLASSKIAELHKRDKKVVIIGGTYLYIKVLLSGLIEVIPSPKNLRDELKKLRSIFGTSYLYGRLEAIDPEAALKIHFNDYVRIERALEVNYLTGRKISEIHSLHDFGENSYDYVKVGISIERGSLMNRISLRVDSMMEQGFVEEVKRLRRMGYSPQLKPMRSIGYKEINSYIDGEVTLDEAVELIKLNTKRLAKRQMTWLRKDNEIRWFDVPRENDKLVDLTTGFFRRGNLG